MDDESAIGRVLPSEPTGARARFAPAEAAANRRRRRAAQILIAVPMIVFFGLALHGVITDLRVIGDAQRRLAARTAQAIGTVVEVHPLVSLRSGSSTPAGTVAFTTGVGETIRFRAVLEDAGKLGTRIRVFYDPGNPQNHALGADVFGISDLFWDNAGWLVFGSYFLWLLRRIRKAYPAEE